MIRNLQLIAEFLRDFTSFSFAPSTWVVLSWRALSCLSIDLLLSIVTLGEEKRK